eukprot:7073568-Ditylum_brightwellii.AAC.1
MTFSYIDGSGTKLASAKTRHGRPFFSRDGSAEDEMSFRQWYFDIEEEGVIDHPKLILVWPQTEDGQRDDNVHHLLEENNELHMKGNSTEERSCAACMDIGH